MKRLLQNLETVVERQGLKDHDCHKKLPRDAEYRGLGLRGGSLSLEETMLIAGLLWVTRPDFVIELGTAQGASTAAIGAVLKDLGKGKLVSVDIAKNPPEKSKQIIDDMQLPVSFVCDKNSLDFLNEFTPVEGVQYFVFSDTDIPVRPLEVGYVLDHYPKGTMIAVHDTSDLHPLGPMKLKRELKCEVDIVELPSPRGISLLRVK